MVTRTMRGKERGGLHNRLCSVGPPNLAVLIRSLIRQFCYLVVAFEVSGVRPLQADRSARSRARVHLMVCGHRPTAVKANCSSATDAASSAVYSEADVRSGRPSAQQQTAECPAELDGHGVVEDRVDGAVRVDHYAAEQQEPETLVATPGE